MTDKNQNKKTSKVSLQFLDEEADKKRPPLYYIEWEDHATHSEAGWKSWDNRPPECVVIAVGWITWEDDNVIYIANHIDPDDGNHLHGNRIIKSCIVKKVPLKDPYKWKESE